jgi:molecular chaperone DnaK (HSP70)
MYPTRAISRASPYPSDSQIQSVSELVKQQTNGGKEDVMVLQRWNGKLIAERFELPEMEVEIERAVEQVEQKIKSAKELKEEKEEIEKATGTTSEDLQRTSGMVTNEKKKL